MDPSAVSNPYEIEPGADSGAPFANRDVALTRAQQQLADPGAPPLAFMGRRGVGKTALLRQIDGTADESTVTVYMPLDDTPLDDEGEWLLALAQSATAELVRRGFTLSRLTELQPPGDDPRAWLNDAFLTEFLAIIRPHRRAAFLLDDADLLLDAIDRGALPATSLDYLRGLMTQRPQVTFVLTIDEKREADIPRLQPLVEASEVGRLTNLTPEATVDLLRQPVTGLYTIGDDAVTAIYRATNGYPPFVKAFGAALFRRQFSRPSQTTITTEDVKIVTPEIYALATPVLAAGWSALPPSERLVLTAANTLLYENPLRTIDTPAIAAWLVETDYPLDSTTIHAAIRSLEYAERLRTADNGGVMIDSSLLQRWLLENARLGEPARAATERGQPRLMWLAVAVIAALIVGAAVLLSRTNAPDARDDTAPPPTVTLIGAPSP